MEAVCGCCWALGTSRLWVLGVAVRAGGAAGAGRRRGTAGRPAPRGAALAAPGRGSSLLSAYGCAARHHKQERAAGYKKKNFIQAKYDFVDQMLQVGAALEM